MSTIKEKFNKVVLGIEGKEVRSVLKLNIGQKYRIEALKRVNSKFGPRILATFDDFQVFLPKRYSEVFTDVDVEDFNQRAATNESFLVVRKIENSIPELELL